MCDGAAGDARREGCVYGCLMRVVCGRIVLRVCVMCARIRVGVRGFGLVFCAWCGVERLGLHLRTAHGRQGPRVQLSQRHSPERDRPARESH